MSNKDKEVLQFLDSLDDIPAAPSAASSSKQAKNPPPGKDAAQAMALLDELTLQSSRPTRVLTPGPRVRNTTTDGRKNSSPKPSLVSNTAPTASTTATTSVPSSNTEESAAAPGWGWGSVWNTASAALAQAKTVVDEQVKHLPNEQAKKWSEGMIGYVKNAQLDKLGNDLRAVGMSTLTELMNVVAPPISEHEVIQIWLSHDMKGYEGVESLVYRGMARIMEQVEGGDLVVNRGNESKPKDDSKERDIGAIDGIEPALKLAIAELEELSKSEILTEPPRPAVTKSSNPTTYSSVFLRIQPFYSSPFALAVSTADKVPPTQQLQFLLYLVDPSHGITHTTVSQIIPAEWLEIWDEYEWVEDLVVDALRVAVEIIGEQYLVSRMSWGKKHLAPEPEESTISEKVPVEVAEEKKD